MARERWVDVRDRPPPEGEVVTCRLANGKTGDLVRAGERYLDPAWGPVLRVEVMDVTHWKEDV